MSMPNTKSQKAALYEFFSSFGIPAYEETGLLKRPELPYMTYQDVTGRYWDGGIAAHAQIWYQTRGDMSGADSIAKLISERIGTSGCIIGCDGGGILIKRSKTKAFSQKLTDKTDIDLDGRQINLLLEFLVG